MSKFLIPILILFATRSYAQIPKTIFQGDSQKEYSAGDFTVASRTLSQAIGVYHFGESEGETDFIVLPFKGSIIIQISSHTWGKNPKTGSDTWLREFTTFNKVILKGSNFEFGKKYKGIFAVYNGKIKQAILLNGDPSNNIVYGRDSAEVGHYETDLATYFNGKKYPEVSLKVIDEKYLAGKSKQELKYMRNEVFAMYGLIFQNPATAALFNKRYIAWRKDVLMCLTDIEKYNLEIIKNYELKLSK